MNAATFGGIHSVCRRLTVGLVLGVGGVVAAMVVAAAAESSLGGSDSVARRLTGTAGATLVLMTFLYSLRRRRGFRAGSLKQWLTLHEGLGLAGPLVLVVHGGLTFHNPVAVAAEGLAVLIMFSGLVGHLLHQGVRAGLDDLRRELEGRGVTGRALDDQLRLAAGASTVLWQWRVVHYPLTSAFLAAAVCHVLAVFYYGGILP